MNSRLAKTRVELGAFLKARREGLAPQDVGLPAGHRRRTRGLRREEVAALSGVGLSWYTWLEQGRDIGVSSAFLDSLAGVLRLDAAERRHLFLLAHRRPPAEPGRTYCSVPGVISRLLSDLAPNAAYVINLRWDVLDYNDAAAALFRFARHEADQRNLLRLLFSDPYLRDLFVHWETDAPAMLESFRRDHADAQDDPDMKALVAELEAISPEFKALWRRSDVAAPCTGRRTLITGSGPEEFEYTSLTVDGGRHLRLIVYRHRADRLHSEDRDIVGSNPEHLASCRTRTGPRRSFDRS